ILHYARADGTLAPELQRSYLCVADGITGGDGKGPLTPPPRATGAILAGTNPVAVDVVAARLMGLDPDAIPMLRHALADAELAPAGTPAVLGPEPEGLDYEPPPGWESVRA